jgi:hypothetical protein
MPLRSNEPRSANFSPAPATKSVTTRDTNTSFAADWPITRAASNARIARLGHNEIGHQPRPPTHRMLNYSIRPDVLQCEMYPMSNTRCDTTIAQSV